MKKWIVGTVLAIAYAAAQDVNVAGDWIWTILGAQGENIEVNVSLKQDGSKVTGVFDMGERKLEIDKGSIEGNVLKLTVKRNRPQGGTMVYQMEGKVDGDKIAGTTSTDLDGQVVTQELKARRKN